MTFYYNLDTPKIIVILTEIYYEYDKKYEMLTGTLPTGR